MIKETIVNGALIAFLASLILSVISMPFILLGPAGAVIFYWVCLAAGYYNSKE